MKWTDKASFLAGWILVSVLGLAIVEMLGTSPAVKTTMALVVVFLSYAGGVISEGYFKRRREKRSKNIG